MHPPGSCHSLPHRLDALSWLVAITNLAAERRASAAIERECLIAYCPLEIRPVIRQHRRHIVSCPLLPRYVFVGFNPESQGPHQLRAMDGVEGLVRVDSQAVTVPPAAVEELVARELAGEFDKTAADARKALRPRYHTGEAVKAVHGPFMGIRGHVARAFKSGQVDVLLALFGRQVRTRFHEADLTASACC
jgi:transcription antitermination factor NusG